jgi:hypothetical protein
MLWLCQVLYDRYEKPVDMKMLWDSTLYQSRDELIHVLRHAVEMFVKIRIYTIAIKTRRTRSTGNIRGEGGPGSPSPGELMDQSS